MLGADGVFTTVSANGGNTLLGRLLIKPSCRLMEMGIQFVSDIILLTYTAGI
jgi:hypothetical protein